MWRTFDAGRGVGCRKAGVTRDGRQADVGAPHALAAGGGESIHDGDWGGDVSHLEAAASALAPVAIARAVLAGSGGHRTARFGDDESPGIRGVVDDEGAAINEPVQGLEQHGERLPSLDFFDA